MIMGDLLLKQKPPPLHHLPQWQNQEIVPTKQAPQKIHKLTKKDINRNIDVQLRNSDRTKDSSFRYSDSSRSSEPSIRYSDPGFRHSDLRFRPHEPPFRPHEPPFIPEDPPFRSQNPLFKPNDPPFRPIESSFRSSEMSFRQSDKSFRPSDHLRKSQDFRFINGSTQDLHLRHVPPFSPSSSPPHDFQKWRETAYYPTQVISYPPAKPNGEHYFLAPYYRNVMPPPPNLQNSQRLLMVDSRKRFSMSMGTSHSSCHCRSRSMEDVRTQVVEIREDRWPVGHHGKMVNGGVGLSRGGSRVVNDSRRSMDNLSSADVGYTNSPTLASTTRVGRLQVFKNCVLIINILSIFVPYNFKEGIFIIAVKEI